MSEKSDLFTTVSGACAIGCVAMMLAGLIAAPFRGWWYVLELLQGLTFGFSFGLAWRFGMWLFGKL